MISARINNFLEKYKIIFGFYFKNHLYKVLFAIFLIFIEMPLILPTPYLTKKIVDDAIPHEDLSLLLKLTVLIIIIFFIRKAISFTYNIFFFKLNSLILLDLRRRLLKKTTHLSFSKLDTYEQGYLFSRITTDPGYINALFGEKIISLVKEFLMVAIGIMGAAFISIKLTILAVIVLPIFILVSLYFSRKMKNIFTIFLEEKAHENARLQESLHILKFLKRCSREILSLIRYFKAAKKTHKTNLSYGKYYFGNIVFSETITILVPAIIFSYCAYLIINGEFTLGSAIAFNGYLAYIYNSLNQLINSNVSIQVALASFERILEFLEMKGEEKAQILTTNLETIRFEQICFAYPKSKNILTNLDLNFKKGEKTAIIGESGSGKTTIIKLLLGEYELNSGAIIINEEIYSTQKLRALRKYVAIVEQEPIIIKDSIKTNLQLLNKKASEEEIIQITKLVNIHNFIMNLPSKYETMIGDGEINLSIGQKQRIAIARALLKSPKILIFDEPTSSLDKENERIFIELLQKLVCTEMIVIIISHKKAPLALCDKVYDLASK